MQWGLGRRFGYPNREVSDVQMGTVVAATATAAAGNWGLVIAVGAVAAATVIRNGRRSWPFVVLILVMVLFASGRGDSARAAIQRTPMGEVAGWTKVVTEAQRTTGGLRVIVEVDGHRYECWVRGRAMKIRVEQWRGGQLVRIVGRRQPLSRQRQKRVAWEHVVGELDIDYVTDVGPASAVDRASNHVRAIIERGAAVLPGDDGALFRGLVIGDDRDQPDQMIQRFRASGLSHLTAVSGQNVSFLLMALSPLLPRLRPLWRWVATVLVIAWFVSLTRFEPSILRAGMMAAISATAFATGRQRSPFRLLALAVTALILIDPLIVGSIGFWLSVGATAGVAVVGPVCTHGLRSLGLLADPIGVTLGAQVGVALPALLVFGTLPLVSIPANLLAVPVAGFVMLFGLPAALVAGLCPPIAPVVMLPCRLAVRWVDLVAALGAKVEPHGVVVWLGWVLVAVAVALIAWHAHTHPPTSDTPSAKPSAEARVTVNSRVRSQESVAASDSGAMN